MSANIVISYGRRMMIRSSGQGLRSATELTSGTSSEVNATAGLLRKALEYAESGFSVIPIRAGTKKPLCAWKEFQQRRPTESEVGKWWQENPDAQIGLVTGKVSGNFAVIDFDSSDAYGRFWGSKAAQLESETCVVTTARGRHVWVRTLNPPPSFKIPGLVDVKGEGGYVVGPPSIHPSGRKYEFANPDIPFSKVMTVQEDLEDWFWKKAAILGYVRRDYSALHVAEHSVTIKAALSREKKCISEMLSGVGEGCRNAAAFALALEWKLHGVTEEEAIQRIHEWNKANKPPDPDETSLAKTVESAFARNYPVQLVCRKAAEIGKGCDEGCVYHRAPPFSAEAVIKAKELAKDPLAFLRFTQGVLDTRLAGEYRNRLFMLLAGASRNIKTTIVRIYGPNSAGKKMLYAFLVDLFGEENVVMISSATAAWLKRKVMAGFQTKGKIFILIEDRGDPENNLRYQFEQIYSEDKIRLGLTIKGEKEWEAVIVELQGPLTFITTSTELEESYHAATRAWEVNPDESRQQGELISAWYRRRHLLPIKALEQEKRDLEVLRAYLSTLPSWGKIVVPYIQQIKFEYRNLADRRKLPDFVSLVQTVTYLFSEICPKDKENGILFSVPFAFDIAATIAADIISVSRGSLNRGERRLWSFIQQHFDEIRSVTTDGKAPREFESAEAFLVSDLVPGRPEFSDVHANTMRNWLNGLVRKGFLRRTGLGRGRGASYALVYNSGLVNSNAENAGLIPELGPVSAQDFEITTTQIYEGMPKPTLNPPFRSISPLGNCELVDYRIKPEMLDFKPTWRKSEPSSSQMQVCDRDVRIPQTTFLDGQVKQATTWLKNQGGRGNRSEFLRFFRRPVLDAMLARNLVWDYSSVNGMLVLRN
jgi:hypothetical protein